MFSTWLYTTFLVYVLKLLYPCVAPVMIWILRSWKERALEKATYNCPWENTGCGKNKPTFSNNWPWDFSIVIAYERRIGNCVRLRINRKSVSEGASGSFGMKTFVFSLNSFSGPIFCQPFLHLFLGVASSLFSTCAGWLAMLT